MRRVRSRVRHSRDSSRSARTRFMSSSFRARFASMPSSRAWEIPAQPTRARVRSSAARPVDGYAPFSDLATAHAGVLHTLHRAKNFTPCREARRERRDDETYVD